MRIFLDLQSEEPENLLTKWMIARSYQEMDDLDTAYEHYQELTGDLKDNQNFWNTISISCVNWDILKKQKSMLTLT